MSEIPPSFSDDGIAYMRSLLDQLESVYRDTVAESVVRMERTILRDGGSPELAVQFSMEWGRRLLILTKLGVEE